MRTFGPEMLPGVSTVFGGVSVTGIVVGVVVGTVVVGEEGTVVVGLTSRPRAVVVFGAI